MTIAVLWTLKIITITTFLIMLCTKLCSSCRISKLVDELDSTLIEKNLREHLPHWTPPKGDKIVYSTVDEGGSANIMDVGKYLDKLKADLHIGERLSTKKFVNRRSANVQIN